MVATSTVPSAVEITAIADAIIAAERELTAAEARSMLDIAPGTDEAAALFAGAQRIRTHFLGTTVHACSILNAKAGGCSENCSYCSQASGSANVDYDKYRWMEDDDIVSAAESAAQNGAGALGLVAAWKGVKEGRQLDMICDSVSKLIESGAVRADVNLGILETQNVADRLKGAGVKVYGHNLETARSFFDETCSSHSFEERMRTIEFVKNSGMKLCSGGIIGMGENKDQRIEFAEQLRFIEPHMVPVNFLNPLEGTGFEDKSPVDCDEALVTLATFRFFLPSTSIMVAGGKEVTFGDRLSEVFTTGINAVMVGNYLTTLGTTPEWWFEQAQAHGLSIQSEGATDCGSDCGCG
ncbi:MAG: biotin synthase BioB [Planctomycetota bacterium]|jgi:biotin synthase|nr:biotin synthase BioB [Planctomycetota bacterium]